MRIWSLGQISPDEKDNILSQHREIYNGYQTMQPEVPNTRPLYVQDFANDKQGLVVTNKGVVKPYSNFGINESITEQSTCKNCDCEMVEGKCTECGINESINEESTCKNCGCEMVEGKCTECGLTNEDIADLSKDSKFDYTEDELDIDYDIEEQDISGSQGVYGSMKRPYNFHSDGPGSAGPYQTSSYESELDENILESVKEQRNKVMNLFERMSKFG
jgi:hypothetical protein